KGAKSMPRLKSVEGPKATSTSGLLPIEREQVETTTILQWQLANRDEEQQRHLDKT
ncbi:hypothetical protein TorRG33x02_225820, partial [Trema orientale]